MEKSLADLWKSGFINNGRHNEMAIDARKCQGISSQEMLDDRL